MKLYHESKHHFFDLRKFCSKSCGAKERKASLKTRLAMSLRMKNSKRRPPSWDELTPEQQKIVRIKHSEAHPGLGKKLSMSHKTKLSESHKGEKSSTWKGGITFAKNYKRIKKAEYFGRKWSAEGSHTKTQWDELKTKYNYMCLCCKLQEPFIKLTEDHIVPLSVGGSDFIENIQPLCQSCNSKKWTKILSFLPAEEFNLN